MRRCTAKEPGMTPEHAPPRMKSPPLRMALVVAALVICAIFPACSRTEPKSVSPPEKVAIALSSTTDSVLAQVAHVKGHYRQEGLETTPQLYPYGKLALQAVLEGKADFATVAETPVMLAIMKGAKLSIIATIQSSQRANAIIARKDRGIHTINDLRGKRIAATLGTSSDFYLDSVLSVKGIARNAVKVVDMKAEEMTGALANGDIDAISTFYTYAIPASKSLGERGIIFQDDDIYTLSFNIVATQEFIRNNPEKVKKLIRALVKAEEYVRDNPAEAQKIVAGFSSVDMAIVRDIWNETSFRVSLDQMLILALEDESRWAIKNKLTSVMSIPNYLDFIYFDGLKAIKPDAVRILR